MCYEKIWISGWRYVFFTFYTNEVIKLACLNAQADLDLHWAHMYIIGFVKKRLTFFIITCTLDCLPLQSQVTRK